LPNPSAIQSILDEARNHYVYSGYQLFAERGARPLDLCGGTTSYWPDARPIASATLFDIGSVTKAVVTTSLVALAVQAGELGLSEPVGEWLVELRQTRLGSIRLEHLLSHSGGLVGWYPVFRETTKRTLIAWFASRADRVVTAPPGKQAVYSDLGFLLLGEILERLGLDLRRAFQARVGRPLGLGDVGFGPVTGDAAATELSAERGRLLRGEVFDDNCFGLGGICAHAGLFASAAALAPWCREWLKAVQGHSGWLSRDTALRFTRPAGLVPGSSWALGWDTRSKTGSTAGSLFSLRSFGHLGYPGCSVWIDPEQNGFVSFFTNRVHPSRLDERIRGVRPRVHDAVARYWRGT
jgi:CubicO group peptidase (beta-lactamase class C family)